MRTELFQHLVQDFQDPEARYAYVDDFLNASVAAQIKNLREMRGLKQAELAERIGTQQPGIARLESINYDAWKVETLRKIARAYDLWVDIQFREFADLPSEIDKFGRRLRLRGFKEDPVFNPRIGHGYRKPAAP